MDSIGGFHEVETDDKLSQLVYCHPDYQPIPQTQTPTSSSGEAASHNHPFQPLFLCPIPRILKGYSGSPSDPVSHSPEYVVPTRKSDKPYEDHSILPLFWCNNKQFDIDGGCGVCSNSNFGTDYYFCVRCDKIFHKECVQSPFNIKHPYHPEHFLQLFYRKATAPRIECLCCRRGGKYLVYYCTKCDVVMHTICAMKMILVGGFHEVEKDGKLSQLVYHPPKRQTIPQTQISISSYEAVCHDHPVQPLFSCPFPRVCKGYSDSLSFPVSYSPEYVRSTIRSDELSEDHSILPLFWCNNMEFNIDGGCHACGENNLGAGYYFCHLCDHIYHKECVESPFIIIHPYHPEHFLQLFGRKDSAHGIECSCCGRIVRGLVYFCTICEVGMHIICAMKSIPFVVDQPKRHDHPLTFFPRQASLTCNVCGLLRSNYPTYVCLRCNFTAHNDCMYSPRIIKISRHHHRISYTFLLQFIEWSCGVCRKIIYGDYGAYTCDKCGDYAVHVRCALREDVWDGVELEGIPEEDDISQDSKPFEMISEGVILHFLHDHYLRLEVNMLYDEKKLCQACVMPISEGECDFGVDVRCAAISEPFDFQGHEHPLFLALHPEVKPICEVCKSECYKQFNCIECDYIVCIKCATLPYKARYKHDKHLLTLFWGTQVCEKDWCEVCERNLKDTNTKLFYWCNDCCTTLHIACLFDDDLYMKPGQIVKVKGKEVKVIAKRNLSRPLCDSCKYPCQGRVFTTDNKRACSMKCAGDIVTNDENPIS